MRQLPLYLTLLFLIGCESPLTRDLREASRLVEQGRCASALPQLNQIITQHPQAPETAEAYYLRGLCRSRTGQLEPAALDFVQAADRAPKRKNLVASAQASLAMIHYQWHNWSRAADLYAQSVDELDDRPPTDLILFYAGVSMQRAGRWSAAKTQFARILNVPALRERPIARDAYAKFSWPSEYFSIQIGSFQDPTRAQAAERAFAAKGFQPWHEYREPVKRWIILTGKFPTYDQAHAALPRVQAVQSDALIVP